MGGKIRNEHTKMSIPTFFLLLPYHHHQHTHTTTATIWYHHLSLTAFFVCVCCLRVLCRPLKVRQIDAKGPRIYQMELSDYLRFFLLVALRIDVFTPVVNREEFLYVRPQN